MDPVLIHLPEQIETDRLIIRPPRAGEGSVVNAAICESLAELKPWMPWAQSAPSVDDTEANLRRAIAKYIAREDLRLQFHLKDGTFVGSSGLHRIDWGVKRFEIGYWIRTSMAGQGFVTEAVRAIADFTLTTLQTNRVEIKCDVENARSRKVAESAGFEFEGILRNDSLDSQNKPRSTAIYSRVAG